MKGELQDEDIHVTKVNHHLLHLHLHHPFTYWTGSSLCRQ